MKTVKFTPPKASSCGNDGCYLNITIYGNVVRKPKTIDVSIKMKKAA